jgi:hypothetical protein
MMPTWLNHKEERPWPSFAPWTPHFRLIGSSPCRPRRLVNLFTVDAADVDALLKASEHDALWMKRQTGYISTQLHRAVGDSCLFLNYAVWESVKLLRQAFTHPQLRNHIGNYPSSAVVSPHLFKKMAITNLCVA